MADVCRVVVAGRDIRANGAADGYSGDGGLVRMTMYPSRRRYAYTCRKTEWR